MSTPPPPPPPGPRVRFYITGGIFGTTNKNPFFSLGGQQAALVTDDKLDNLFDPVSSNEQTNGRTEYRWITVQNRGTEPFLSPHFYFLPKDPYVDIELSRLGINIPPKILPTEEDRPSEEEIGPELDVPMPFEKTTEAYETTLSVGPDIPVLGKLWICVRRRIPEGAVSENRGFRLVCETRIMSADSSGAFIKQEELGGELKFASAPGR